MGFVKTSSDVMTSRAMVCVYASYVSVCMPHMCLCVCLICVCVYASYVSVCMPHMCLCVSVCMHMCLCMGQMCLCMGHMCLYVCLIRACVCRASVCMYASIHIIYTKPNYADL